MIYAVGPDIPTDIGVGDTIQFNGWILPKKDSIQYSIQYCLPKIHLKLLFKINSVDSIQKKDSIQ